MIGEDLTSNSFLYNDLFYSNNLGLKTTPVKDFLVQVVEKPTGRLVTALVVGL